MFRLELVHASAEDGAEDVIESGTLRDLPALLARMKTLETGHWKVAYVRVFDENAGEYLSMHFGVASDIAEAGVYCG